jgi:phosphopantothenoylcysteine decarboxylase/phosphopantothenate--cysteine ligase
LELIRLLRKNGAMVQCILTSGGQKFITPLSVSALTGQTTYTDLWSLKDETEMGHIRLAREADAILVAPASANIMARIAHGLADAAGSTSDDCNLALEFFHCSPFDQITTLVLLVG